MTDFITKLMMYNWQSFFFNNAKKSVNVNTCIFFVTCFIQAQCSLKDELKSPLFRTVLHLSIIWIVDALKNILLIPFITKTGSFGKILVQF